MELEVKNLKKDYWKYIIPSLVAQVVFTLYTMVDALMVARGVSARALAGVNIASPYVTVLWAMAIMFAVGTSTIVARLMGENQAEIADEVFSQTVFVLIVFSVFFSVLTYIGAGTIADLLGATENTRIFSITYIKTIAPFSLVFITSYLFEILMPVDGHPKLASVVVTIGVVANCVLDYLFIFILKKGVWGAAFATGISQTLVTVLFLLHFLSKNSNIKFVKFKFKGKLIGQEIWRGLPSGIAEVSPGIAVFIFVRVIGKYIGEDGLLAYSTVSYISAILVIIAVAVGQGSQPLISYYNGAKRPDVIKKILSYEFRTVAISGILLFICIWCLAPAIVNLFIGGESLELIDYSINAFRLFITFSLIDVYSIVLAQYATALERPISGILISSLRSTVFLILGIFIAMKILGTKGIWLGMTASEAITLILAVIMYKKNHAYLLRS